MQDILLNNFKHSDAHFEQLIDLLPIGIAMIDFESGHFLKVNKSLLKSTGYSKKEFLNLDFWDITPKKYKKQEKQQIKDLIKYKKFGPNEKEYIRKDGSKYPIKISGFLLSNSDGKEVVWGLIEDITLAKQDEIIYKDNKKLLEYIAIESSLTKSLRKIVRLAEKRNKGSMCSILLLDKEKKYLFTACAPSLPNFYTEAINGIEIGEKVGSCGSATYKKQRVVVKNIDTHENWQDYLELTKKANLHSCWSEPIFSSKNEILGSFAIYTNKHKYPTNFEKNLIETYSSLVSKALEKDLNTKEIIEREIEVEQLFDNTQIGVMYSSSKGVITKANQKLAKIFGYENALSMIGINLKKLHISEEKFKEFKNGYLNILENNSKLEIEYQLQKKDASIIWCEMSGKTLSPNDFSKGIIWMIKDISLRKTTELQLRTSEILNKNILSTIPDLIWLKDKNGVYITCNPEFEKYFGKKHSEIIGKTDYDITSVEVSNFYKKRDLIAMQAKKTVINEEWITHNISKEKTLLEISKKALIDQDGNMIGILGIGHNITKRKEKEEELKRLTNEQNVLLSLFDKGDTVLFKWKNDENWSTDYVSSNIEKLFGYKKEEFLSNKINYIACIHKDDLDTVVKEVEVALKENLDYFKHKPYRIITKDGEEKWILDNTVTLKNEEKEITDAIGYIIDITEQVKNQELLFQQSKIASLGEMLDNISHQWRQPLSAISSLATGCKLKKEINILETEEFNENMDLINNNAQYLSKTIDDFRNFFVDNSNIKKITNLKDTFEIIYSLVKDSFKNSNIEIIFNLENSKIMLNENIFIQAILNILNNSRDALNEKNHNDFKYVFIDLKKNENYYFLSIKDNAGGIPSNIIDKIFEPYFTTKHKSQGTGIALYMTNQIITKHLLGEINVRNCHYSYNNKKFDGAIFEIKIPI